MDEITENLHYILWKKPALKAKFKHLANVLKCSEHRAARLLQNTSSLSTEELTQLALYSGFSEEEIQFSRLVESEDIFRENISFLFDELPKDVTQKQIALELGVKEITVSRWKSSAKQTPPPKTQARLLKVLGIPEETNLSQDPLFLSINPVSIYARKLWLKDRIDELDTKELQLLFPSLQKLLASSTK